MDVEHCGSFGRLLDWGLKGCSFETCQSHCVVSLSKTLYLLLSTDSTDRKTGNHPDITEKLLTAT